MAGPNWSHVQLRHSTLPVRPAPAKWLYRPSTDRGKKDRLERHLKSAHMVPWMLSRLLPPGPLGQGEHSSCLSGRDWGTQLKRCVVGLGRGSRGAVSKEEARPGKTIGFTRAGAAIQALLVNSRRLGCPSIVSSRHPFDAGGACVLVSIGQTRFTRCRSYETGDTVPRASCMDVPRGVVCATIDSGG